MDVEAEKALLCGRLRKFRIWTGCSEQDAAEAAGVPVTAYRSWERGKAMPNLLQYRALLALFGTNGYQILFGEYPFQFTRAEAAELQQAAKSFSPQLRSRVDVMMALLAEPGTNSGGQRAGAAV